MFIDANVRRFIWVIFKFELGSNVAIFKFESTLNSAVGGQSEFLIGDYRLKSFRRVNWILTVTDRAKGIVYRGAKKKNNGVYLNA